MSALLPTVADPAWSECSYLERCYDRLWPAGSVSLPELLGALDREVAQFAPVLKISMPARSLADSYAEANAVAAS